MLDVSKKNEENLIKKFEATEKRFEFRDITKTDVFQAKARLAEATSKRIEAENNLDISISDFETVVGRKPDINWFESNNTQVTTANPKDWSKFGVLPKIPSTLEQSINVGLKNNPDYVQTLIQFENAKYYKERGCCWIIEQDTFEEKIEDLLNNIIKDNKDYLKKKENLKKINYQNTWINVNEKILKMINEN